MPDIRVQDEQGNIHVFPDGSTPEMIAQAMNVKVSSAPSFAEKLGQAAEKSNYGTGDFGNPDHPAHRMMTEALADLKAGNYAKGAHGLIGAGQQFLKPTLPLVIGAAPIAAAVGFGSGYVGTKTGQKVAELAGATPEQQELAGDIGGFAASVGGGKLASLRGTAAEVAPKLYQSALKPSTTMSASKVSQVINTGLKQEIPVSPAGAEKIGTLIDDLNQQISGKIQQGAGQGVTVNKFAVTSRLGDTAKQFGSQVNPVKDLNTIGRAGNEFLKEQPGEIPADQAQAIKQGTYQQISKSYGKLSNAAIESQKSLARGIKEELASQIPEIGSLNEQESQLIGLDKAMERAVNRISNHQLMGIGTPIVAGAAGAVTKSTGIGAAAGIIKAVIDDPIVKSKLAIALYKSGKGATPMSLINSRLAAYSASLAGASSAQPPAGQTNGQGASQ